MPLPIMPSKRIENNASRIVVLGAIASEEFMLTGSEPVLDRQRHIGKFKRILSAITIFLTHE